MQGTWDTSLHKHPRFSLIVASRDRTEELAALLQSLALQTMRDFELILIDQNPDERLSPLVRQWAQPSATSSLAPTGCFKIRHLRSIPGVSRARNRGIAYSNGEILAFPDDDCWYQPDTLQNVDAWFRRHEDYGILCLGSRDRMGRVSGNRWGTAVCQLTQLNVFRASATYSYFIRRPWLDDSFAFDETIGPGASEVFGAGEDTDFLLNRMKRGVKGMFYPVLFVGHPSKEYSDTLRAKRYGGGWGRVLAKHSLPHIFLGLAAFDFLRAAGRRLARDPERAAVLWAHGRGMVAAYFSR